MAPTIVGLLTRYITDINSRNFGDYWTLFTHEFLVTFDPAQVVAGYRSTQDSDAQLTDVSAASDGRPAAAVTFVSRQDAADGPNGETCSRWKAVFFLQVEGGTYHFGLPPSEYQADQTAC